MKRILVITLLFFSAITLRAQTDIPKIVTDGLAAYQKSGGKEAIAIWLKGSPVENDLTSRMSMTGGLLQFETAYGKMIGFDRVRVVSISSSLRFVYMILKFDKGPVFARFDCYKANSDWIIPRLTFNLNADVILPANLLAGTQ